MWRHVLAHNPLINGQKPVALHTNPTGWTWSSFAYEAGIGWKVSRVGRLCRPTNAQQDSCNNGSCWRSVSLGGPTGVSMATGGVDGVPIVLIAARPRSETSAAIFQLPNTNKLTPTTKDTRPRIIIFFSFVQLFTHFSFSSLFVVFFPEISPRSFLFFFLCGSGFFFCLRLSCRRGPTGATGRWWHNQPRPEDNARSRGTRPAACGHFIVA